MKRINLAFLFVIAVFFSSFLATSSLQAKSFHSSSLQMHADCSSHSSTHHNTKHENCNNKLEQFYENNSCSYQSCNLSFQALPVFLTPSLKTKALSSYIVFNSYFSSYKTPSLIKPPSFV